MFKQKTANGMFQYDYFKDSSPFLNSREESNRKLDDELYEMDEMEEIQSEYSLIWLTQKIHIFN